MQRRRPMGPPPGYRVFSGFGSIRDRAAEAYGITPQGTPGSPVDPYNERTSWGTGQAGGGVSSPPLIGGGPAVGLPAGVATTPFGVILGADGKPLLWRNPTSVASVPINVSNTVNPPPISNVPVLSLNYARNLLMIQNNSVAPTAGDTAPTMFVGFNAQPSIGNFLALAPGQGVSWDIICPRDSIYIAFGAFVNAGGSVIIQGVVVQGTYAP